MAKGNPDPAVLVRKSWAERVDSATKESAKEVVSERGKQADDASLFYDVRPVKLKTEWTRVSMYLAKADAVFLDKNGAAENDFVFPIYACCMNTAPPRKSHDAVQWAIWRGRWELLSKVPTTNFQDLYLKSGVGVGIYDGETYVATTAEDGGTYELRNTGVLSISGSGLAPLSGYVKVDTTYFDRTADAKLTLKTKQLKVVTGVTLPTLETQTLISGLLSNATRLEVTKNDAGLVTNVELIKETRSVSGLVKTADGAVYDATYNFVRK